MRVARLLLVSLFAVASLTPGSTQARDKDKWCSRKHARNLVYDFIDAYNAGAFRKLNQIFAREPDFFAFYRLSPERTGHRMKIAKS